MKKCNIEPFVLFDGGSTTEERKIRTVGKRIYARINKCKQIAKTDFFPSFPKDPTKNVTILSLLSKEVLING